MAETTIIRQGSTWYRRQPVEEGTGCTGCDASPSNNYRLCATAKCAGRDEVILKVIPEATSKRFRVSPDGNLFITHRLSGRLWKAIKYTRIIKIA